MGENVTISKGAPGVRRALAVGVGVTVALAAGLPLAASTGSSSAAAAASRDGSNRLTSSPSSVISGIINNLTTGLVGRSVSKGDMISVGWAISMTGKHPATKVNLTSITASIPLLCVTEKSKTPQTMVVHLPDAPQTFAANDTALHPTDSTSAAQGYQYAVATSNVCAEGILVPNGKVSYSAKLVSADTTDPFALRFHAVDANTNGGASQASSRQAVSGQGATLESSSGTTKSSGTTAPNSGQNNTNCASASQNPKGGASQCTASWSPQTSSTAAAPAGGTTGGGTGGGSTGGTTGGGTGGGSTGGTTGGGTGGGGTGGTTGGGTGGGGTGGTTGGGTGGGGTGGTTAGGSAATRGTGTGSTGSAGQSGSTATHTNHTAPSIRAPAATGTPHAVVGLSTTAPSEPASPVGPSSTSIGLAPVPLVTPLIGGVVAQVSAALPWKWFGLLAVVDLALIAIIVARRRRSRAESLRALYAGGVEATATEFDDN